MPNQRVLVVDDSPTARLSLDRQLRNWGLTPTVAESGRIAIQAFVAAANDGRPYDTVIMDLEMPDMNGIETLHAIRQALERHQSRVILLTPVERVDVAEERTPLITATLTKPIRPSDLHHALSGQTPSAPPSHRQSTRDETRRPKLQGSILLAEDNAVNQEVTLGMLEVLGFSATAVENGRLAVELLQKQPFSLILMDCQMPEMDGFEATRFIRQREQDLGVRVPIVALTAHALQGDREICLAVGMDDYISKPFTLEQLRTALHRWLPASDESPQTDPPAPLSIPPRPTRPQAEASPVDPQAWESILSLQRPGQPDLLEKILALYLKDSQEVVDKILAAVQAQDCNGLREAAHSLKSRSATLGAWQVAELCKELELRSRSQNLTGATELATTLQQAFSATCRVFQTERQKRAA